MDKLLIYDIVRNQYADSLGYIQNQLEDIDVIHSYLFKNALNSGICNYMIMKFDFLLTKVSKEFPEIAKYYSCTARGEIFEDRLKHHYWVKIPVYCDTKEEILHVLQIRIDILTKIISQLKSSS